MSIINTPFSLSVTCVGLQATPVEGPLRMSEPALATFNADMSNARVFRNLATNEDWSALDLLAFYMRQKREDLHAVADRVVDPSKVNVDGGTFLFERVFTSGTVSFAIESESSMQPVSEIRLAFELKLSPPAQ